MKMGRRKLLQRIGVLVCFLFGLLVGLSSARTSTSKIHGHHHSSPLKINELPNHVVLSNGIVALTLSKPAGLITAVGYNGVENLLQYHSRESQRGYWDINWERPDIGKNQFDTLQYSSFKYRVVAYTKDMIEVSFKTTWDPSRDNGDFPPLNIDKRFILLHGSSGFYSYAILEHLQGWPMMRVVSTRLTFKLLDDMFNYMAITDDMQRVMPSAHDRSAGKPLEFKEAVLLTNPSNPDLKGEVDDKYQYSRKNEENRVHGWISSDPHVGFWMITPSSEFLAGSPFKADLTSHTGPTTLGMFMSSHYAGPDYGVNLQKGEPWKKVFGPVFVYLNSDSGKNHTTLWENAKGQYLVEKAKWPYEFPMSDDFPPAKERGCLTGRLLIRDRFLKSEFPPMGVAHVGLALPGVAGSWQNDAKGYQYWMQTDKNGYFNISGIQAGTYNLYAWVPGVVGDYKYESNIVITPGSHLKMGEFIYYPPRLGPTLWEIGIPDRSAAEFFIPDPSPDRINKLFVNRTADKFRQYGLWDRYTDLYPTSDLVYTIGKSDYTKDWFFAHVTRKQGKEYVPTQWQIQFDMRTVDHRGSYTLRVALASANYAELQVRVNNPNAYPAGFVTGRIGKDNAIARHGIHGQYWLHTVNVPGSELHVGRNTIYLRQGREGLFSGFLYDYIRLEGPPPRDI